MLFHSLKIYCFTIFIRGFTISKSTLAMAAKIKPSMRKNEEDNSDSAQRQKAEAIEGIIKAMDDAGVTLDDLLDHCERQGKIVRRMKTTFRERRLSSGLAIMVREKDDGESGAFSERMKNLWGDAGAFRQTLNGEPDIRYKPIDGMYMVVKPVVEEVKIHDGPVLIDALFKYGTYRKFHVTCLFTGILFGWSFMFSPIVWMDITATDKIFFNSTNSTEAGLPPGLKSFSQVVFTVFLVAASIVFTNDLLMLNRSMRQFQQHEVDDHGDVRHQWRVHNRGGDDAAARDASALPLFSTGWISSHRVL